MAKKQARRKRGRGGYCLPVGRRPSGPAGPLRRRRIELSWSQQEIALRAGISQEAYSKYERGLRVPRVGVAMEIARILDIDPAELLRFFKLAAAA